MDNLVCEEFRVIHKGNIVTLYKLEFGVNIRYEIGTRIEKNEFCAVITRYDDQLVCTPHGEQIETFKIFGTKEYILFGIIIIWNNKTTANVVFGDEENCFLDSTVIALSDKFIIISEPNNEDGETFFLYKKGDAFLIKLSYDLNLYENIKIVGNYLFSSNYGKIHLNDLNADIMKFYPQVSMQSISMPISFMQEYHIHRTKKQRDLIYTVMLVFKDLNIMKIIQRYILSFV